MVRFQKFQMILELPGPWGQTSKHFQSAAFCGREHKRHCWWGLGLSIHNVC